MEFVNNSWILFGMFVGLTLFKLLAPETSFKLKTSLVIASVGIAWFGLKFINGIDNNFNLWPLIYCILCSIYVYEGGKTVAYKTTTGVFSRRTGEPVGHMEAGSLNWADPFFEIVTVSVDGVPNISADLQELEIMIPETPLMQTATRGIQAKVKKISFMLELHGDIKELFRIEGGAETIKERIVDFIEEFFLKKISHLSPLVLDQDKAQTIETLCDELKHEVNSVFCLSNRYPYRITKDVIIADTELEAKYYETLARKEFTRLEQEAKDIEAKSLRERIAEFGQHNLPTGTPKEQTDYALIALGIVKKDIKENKYAVDSDLVQLAKDIALYFKK
jgi:hypothetical protein